MKGFSKIPSGRREPYYPVRDDPIVEPRELASPAKAIH